MADADNPFAQIDLEEQQNPFAAIDQEYANWGGRPGPDPNKAAGLADIYKAGVQGAVRGIDYLGGTVGDLHKLADTAGYWSGNKLRSAIGKQPLSWEDYQAIPKPNDPYGFSQMPSSADIRPWREAVTGPTNYIGKSLPARMAGTVGEFLPSAYAGGTGGILARTIAGAVVPGTLSEAGGTLTQGTPAEPWARALLGVAGGMLGPRVATPSPRRPSLEPHVQPLQQAGIEPNLTAGQITGNENLKRAEEVFSDVMGSGTSTAEMNEGAREAYTRWALNQVGEDHPNLILPNGDRILQQSSQRIGNEFERLQGSTDIHPAEQPQLMNDLIDDVQRYEATKLEHEHSPDIRNTVNEIAGWLGSPITGPMYKQTRSDLARSLRSAKDPEFGQALSNIIESLDDAMERSIGRAGGDVDAWRRVRQQYRNQLVLEHAARPYGQEAALGTLTPARVQSANQMVYGRRAIAHGTGPFTRVTQAMQAAASPLKDSGTAGRLAMLELGGLTGVLTATGEHATNLTGLGAAGAGATGAILGGMFGPALMGRAINSRLGQAYLRNQAIPGAARIPWTPVSGRQNLLSELYASGLLDVGNHPALYPHGSPGQGQ
jgi:hypothetical protein